METQNYFGLTKGVLIVGVHVIFWGYKEDHHTPLTRTIMHNSL